MMYDMSHTKYHLETKVINQCLGIRENDGRNATPKGIVCFQCQCSDSLEPRHHKCTSNEDLAKHLHKQLLRMLACLHLQSDCPWCNSPLWLRRFKPETVRVSYANFSPGASSRSQSMSAMTLQDWMPPNRTPKLGSGLSRRSPSTSLLQIRRCGAHSQGRPEGSKLCHETVVHSIILIACFVISIIFDHLISKPCCSPKQGWWHISLIHGFLTQILELRFQRGGKSRFWPICSNQRRWSHWHWCKNHQLCSWWCRTFAEARSG